MSFWLEISTCAINKKKVANPTELVTLTVGKKKKKRERERAGEKRMKIRK